VYSYDDCKLIDYHAIVKSAHADGMPTAISARSSLRFSSHPIISRLAAKTARNRLHGLNLYVFIVA
jgi:hypothetical protein